jgi:hypothetical protein
MGQTSNSINVPVVTTPGFGISNSRIVRFLPAILPTVGALYARCQEGFGPTGT